ncbi:ParB/RepB/Spo0J family partition protein [Proteiniphilum sp. UBA7639]|jgi:ParB-like chromosome segregation protein Spo0J|uniref:ParB/RepB/Spo0J family partition protein n=1 Tax=Proteiniphilum sp. UBA7639 TaxID=1947289 RepID=UPI000E8952DB|nr:ParB N-terminal domain-containing protein [Proteiniphilum sp. UBA7639]HAX52602.1 hypothetical protein [Lachnospiraceae bacterium]HBI73430.1 hypothetical protein [Lachnospiraceae bacterium]HCS74804.1 hypothetical protein [Clostridiales bacterium]
MGKKDEFDLNNLTDGILNDASKAAIGESFDVVNIPFDDVIPSKNNHYSINGIEELAQNIEKNGLEQNFEVRPGENNKYILMAGHRRRMAIELIRKKDPSKFTHLPCRIIRNIKSDDEEIMRIISNNANNRDKTNADKYNEYIDLKKAVSNLEKQGTLKVEGERRKYYAEQLGVSRGQIERYESIEKYGVPELISLLKANKVSINQAYRISRKKQSEQVTDCKEIEQQIQENGPEENPQTDNMADQAANNSAQPDKTDNATTGIQGENEVAAQPEPGSKIAEGQNEQENGNVAADTTSTKPSNPQPEVLRIKIEDFEQVEKVIRKAKKIVSGNVQEIRPKDAHFIKRDLSQIGKATGDLLKRLK